jgi:putative transposase
MPRAARASVGGVCCHALNRGNGRQQVFFKDGDYLAFLKALAQPCEHIPMRVLGWSLMPNHFHPVLRPHADGDLGRWMHRLENTHVCRYRMHDRGSGHLWQGRFKAFPIQEDEHLLTALRYVERDPMRAGLVDRAEAKLSDGRLIGKWGLFLKDGSEPFRGEWEAVRPKDKVPEKK